jgi:hypothetical protein
VAVIAAERRRSLVASTRDAWRSSVAAALQPVAMRS